MLKSLFIHDLFARSRSDLRELLSAVNNLAFSAGRTMLFILLQSGNPLITMVREAGFQFLSVPDAFLAKGEEFPAQDEKLYIDIRDLSHPAPAPGSDRPTPAVCLIGINAPGRGWSWSVPA